MRVLHVSLGLPPYRTGGLTRYCSDLCCAQAAEGDEVILLYPGRFLPGRTRVRESRPWNGVRVFELINPLPVALTFGVSEPDAFISPPRGGRVVFEHFLGSFGPDVIHVHSFMGVHREFFQVARYMGVPMVFSTHDYYPICPRATLVDLVGDVCSCGPSAGACASCCSCGGMTFGKSVIMQTGMYRALKDISAIESARALVKGRMRRRGLERSLHPADEPAVRGYSRLLQYNRSIFGLFDLVLANSPTAEGIYRRYFPEARYRLCRISHSGLRRSGVIRPRSVHEPARIGYFGGRRAYKGYDTLIEASRVLHDWGMEFELLLYGDNYGDVSGIPSARACGPVPPSEMGVALRGLDIVVVPSRCQETFGFVVLEALCEGIPVVCSDMVGANVLVGDGSVFPAGDGLALASLIMKALLSPNEPSTVPDDYPLSMIEQVEEVGLSYSFVREALVNE